MGKPITIGISDRPAARAIREIDKSLTAVNAAIDALAVRTSVVESGVSSVTSTTSSIVVSPTTGDVTVSLGPIPESAITGLVADLAAKAPLSHTHAESDITGLVADLAARPTGSGTSGRSTRWTGASALSDGAFLDDGTNASLAGTLTLSTFTAGSVLFAGAAGLVSQDNAKLFWDDTNNRLGIDTNAPSKPLHVAGDACVTGSSSILTVGTTGITMPAFVATSEFSKDSSFNSSINSVYSATAAHCGEFMVFRGRGTGAAPSAVLSGDALGQFAFTGATSGTTHFSGALIQGSATENWGPSNVGAKLEFYTTTNAAGGAGRLVRMTIDHDGATTIAQTLSLTPMTTGSILFAGTGGLVSQDNAGLFWNDSTNQLVVGAAGATKAGTAGRAEFTRDSAAAKVTVSTYGTSVSSELSFLRGRGTAASSSVVQSGDTLGNVAYAGMTSATNAFGSAFISGLATETWSGSAAGSRISFTTCLNTTTTRLAKLAIENDGGITLTNSGSAAVSAASELRLRYVTSPIHKLQSSPNTGAYTDVLISSSAAVGVANNISKWTATNAQGTSLLSDDATTLNYNSKFAVTAATGVAVFGAAAITKAAFVGTFEVTRDANSQVLVSSYGTGATPELATFRGRGTGASTTAVQSADVLGQVVFSAAHGSTNVYAGGLFRALATENWVLNTNGGTKLEFYTTANTTQTRTLRLTIDQDGTTTIANNGVVSGTLGVTGLATLTAGFTLGADSSAASHKITNLTNGSAAQDAAAFGQLATAVNAAVSGTTNTLAKFTSANVVGNSSITDNGTTVAVTGALTVSGGATLGDATSDAHTVNGSLTVTDDGSAVSVTATPVGATAQRIACTYVMQGTYDTTGGNITAIGTYGAISSAKSAGASTLTNVGILANASGGDVNVALQTNAGNVILNAVSGTTTITGAATCSSTLAVTGNVAVNTNKFTVTATSGDTLVAGVLTVGATATIRSGTGSPETVVTAPVGSLFLRTDGGAGTTLYVKESGAGNTGWVAK